VSRLLDTCDTRRAHRPPPSLLFLSLASSTNAGAGPDDAAARNVLEVLYRLESFGPTLTATFFAVGSLAFAWLFIRGDIIPRGLAWLGVFASALLVIGLPLKLAGWFAHPKADMMWIPMALFEIPLGFYMLMKGARAPVGTRIE
jgi:hypothetical protein